MKKPTLMGILNVTPDSFFDRGAYFSPEKAIEHASLLQKEGADLVDIGGVSSQPGAQIVSAEEELARVLPVLKALEGKMAFSIDTCSPEVAKVALKFGACMINNIAGFEDQNMQDIAADSDVDLCVMHMQGTPQTMQLNPSYPEGVAAHVFRFFEERVEALVKKGIKQKRIILDPGIGFGKTVEDNIALIKAIDSFKKLGFRLLVGASRKSFMAKILKKERTQLLPATLAIHTMSLAMGADILRVHDVSAHRDVIDLLNYYFKQP